MVNVSKRMHKLMPKLWRVKGGAGAAILPPKSPKPQLTGVTLRIPNPANGYDGGAHSFWRKYLPALRYHNLTLPIQVEQKKDAESKFAPTLTLNFEATTKKALEEQYTKPRSSDDEVIAQWKSHIHQIRQDEQLAEISGGSPVQNKTQTTRVEKLRKQQEDIGIPNESRTTVGEITIKPQAAADPAAPSSTSPPSEIYQRSVTLALRGRRALDIWKWFQLVTEARPYKLNRDERLAIREHAKFEKTAQEDRVRVKKGIDAMKREKEELKRAKEAAERLAEA